MPGKGGFERGGSFWDVLFGASARRCEADKKRITKQLSDRDLQMLQDAYWSATTSAHEKRMKAMG